MKVRVLYKCEICGVEYADKDEALKCESFHKKPKKVKGLRYNGMNVSQYPYPATIIVEFDDGKQLEYKR